MPIQIAELLNDERTITLTIGGQEGKVTYRPGAMTPELEMRVSQDTEMAVLEIVSEAVATWDVIGEDGQPIETDVDTLMTLPSEVVTETFKAIMHDLADRREERKNSGDGSPREASKAKRRNGTSFSRPQKR